MCTYKNVTSVVFVKISVVILLICGVIQTIKVIKASPKSSSRSKLHRNIVYLNDEIFSDRWANKNEYRPVELSGLGENNGCGNCIILGVKPDDFSELNWEDKPVVIFSVNSYKKYHKLLDSIPETVVKILYWREAYYPYLTPDIQAKFDVLMGTQFTATILNPCHYESDWQRILPIVKRPFENRKHFAVFISSRCNDDGVERYDGFRSNFIERLGELVDVKIYGKCGKKKYGLKLPDKRKINKAPVLIKKFYSKFKYYLAVENTGSNTYISEKIFNSLGSEAIPVYFGATDIDKFPKLDGRSEWFINARDFSSVEELAAFLIDLAGDEKRFNQYLKWQEYAINGGKWMPNITDNFKDCFDSNSTGKGYKIKDRKRTICKLCDQKYLETIRERGRKKQAFVKIGYPSSWNMNHTYDDNDAGFLN